MEGNPRLSFHLKYKIMSYDSSHQQIQGYTRPIGIGNDQNGHSPFGNFPFFIVPNAFLSGAGSHQSENLRLHVILDSDETHIVTVINRNATIGSLISRTQAPDRQGPARHIQVCSPRQRKYSSVRCSFVVKKGIPNRRPLQGWRRA